MRLTFLSENLNNPHVLEFQQDYDNETIMSVLKKLSYHHISFYDNVGQPLSFFEPNMREGIVHVDKLNKKAYFKPKGEQWNSYLH